MLYAIAPDAETIAYRLLPGNDPVLLIHGFGSNARQTWDDTGWSASLADAGRGALLVDLRGHGASGKPRAASAYRLTTFAADLCAVLDRVGLASADVIGYSMGTSVARALVRDAPFRVRRLVLGGVGPREQFRFWGVDAACRALLDGSSTGNAFADRILASAAAAPGADPAALAACVAGVAEEPLEAAPLGVPTLIVGGTDDPVAVGAEQFAAELDADFVPLPGRNHINALTARAFKNAALDFLAAAAAVRPARRA
jgi:pimeloyl-ACP methyl ester carboxylesterase